MLRRRKARCAEDREGDRLQQCGQDLPLRRVPRAALPAARRPTARRRRRGAAAEGGDEPTAQQQQQQAPHRRRAACGDGTEGGGLQRVWLGSAVTRFARRDANAARVGGAARAVAAAAAAIAVAQAASVVRAR